MRILLLCAGMEARGPMTDGFARLRKPGDCEIVSAGLQSTAIHPMAVKVMGEIGVDVTRQQPVLFSSLKNLDFDILITLCAEAAAQCPLLPGHPLRVNWNLPDPAAVRGDEEQVRAAFRAARDDIRRLVDEFFSRGYLASLVEAKHSENLILENITDGIIAHDLKRHIFYFNHAAEVITGYRRADVLGRDCHEVLDGGLCDGKCQFDDKAATFGTDPDRRQVEISTRDGERRLVDMLLKPMLDGEGRTVGALVSFHDITREHTLARRVGEMHQFSGIIGHDAKMLEVFDLIRDLANTNVPVLIQGDSGTGKELVAAAIHNEGPRANRLFVPVNCGALPESLLESELFGHVKGSFTGAIRDKKGRFELADGGTIFLDEIGDITPAMQVKLMRVLQEGTFERVGSEKTLKVDVRVISATNKDLTREIEKGRFREDLFYRLSVVPLWLPALRERRNDIPLLVDYVLKKALDASGRKDVTVSTETLNAMMSYDWPGNVRELQNWIQFALVKCKDNVIRPEHLPPPRGSRTPAGSLAAAAIAPPAPVPDIIKKRQKLDAAAVQEALRQTGDNRVEAARVLGISRATLYRLMETFGIAGQEPQVKT